MKLSKEQKYLIAIGLTLLVALIVFIFAPSEEKRKGSLFREARWERIEYRKATGEDGQDALKTKADLVLERDSSLLRSKYYVISRNGNREMRFPATPGAATLFKEWSDLSIRGAYSRKEISPASQGIDSHSPVVTLYGSKSGTPIQVRFGNRATNSGRFITIDGGDLDDELFVVSESLLNQGEKDPASFREKRVVTFETGSVIDRIEMSLNDPDHPAGLNLELTHKKEKDAKGNERDAWYSGGVEISPFISRQVENTLKQLIINQFYDELDPTLPSVEKLWEMGKSRTIQVKLDLSKGDDYNLIFRQIENTGAPGSSPMVLVQNEAQSSAMNRVDAGVFSRLALQMDGVVRSIEQKKKAEEEKNRRGKEKDNAMPQEAPAKGESSAGAAGEK